jgi:hypothetical protein
MNSQVWQVIPGRTGEATAGPLDRWTLSSVHRHTSGHIDRWAHLPSDAYTRQPGLPLVARVRVALASCESEAQSPQAPHHPVPSVLITACRVVPFIKEDTGPDPSSPSSIFRLSIYQHRSCLPRIYLRPRAIFDPNLDPISPKLAGLF